MTEGPIVRFLQLVQHELGADDARAEIGGLDPTDERTIFCRLPGGWRIVALFSEPPADRATAIERLERLADSFFATATSASDAQPRLLQEPAARRLDEELAALAQRAGALSAIVIDDTSPVIWGSSQPRHRDEGVEQALEAAKLDAAARALGIDLADLISQETRDVEALLQQRGVDAARAGWLSRAVTRLHTPSGERNSRGFREYLTTARAIAEVRQHIDSEGRPAQNLRAVVREDRFGYVVRSFATIYHLIVAFDGAFSELHAEAAVLHALPIIERLVLALPPSQPPPRGGRVLRLEVPK
jgi:hypothetical protein